MLLGFADNVHDVDSSRSVGFTTRRSATLKATKRLQELCKATEKYGVLSVYPEGEWCAALKSRWAEKDITRGESRLTPNQAVDSLIEVLRRVQENKIAVAVETTQDANLQIAKYGGI